MPLGHISNKKLIDLIDQGQGYQTRPVIDPIYYYHISSICDRSRSKTTQDGSDTTVGKRVGYDSNNSKIYHAIQEAKQVDDHKSLPLDAQSSGRRVGAAWSNEERVDVLVVVDRPASSRVDRLLQHLRSSLRRSRIVLKRNNVVAPLWYPHVQGRNSRTSVC